MLLRCRIECPPEILGASHVEKLSMDPKGAMFMIVDSKSRGNWGVLDQMLGMRGIFAKPSGALRSPSITSWPFCTLTCTSFSETPGRIARRVRKVSLQPDSTTGAKVQVRSPLAAETVGWV